MNRALLAGIAIFFLFSCKKSIDLNPGRFIDLLQFSLRDSLDRSPFADLDFSQAILSKKDNLRCYYVRIPFRERNTGFLLLKTDMAGNLLSGRRIEMQGALTRQEFQGHIEIRSLEGKPILSSPVRNGFIAQIHSFVRTELLVEPAPKELPEVVVYSSISDGGISYFPILSFGGLFGEGGSSYGGFYYTDGSGYKEYAPEKGLVEEELISIDPETYVTHPPIDLEAYLACFATIPDAGASYSIELLTDIPVDADPTKLFDVSSQSPGHSFIQLKKSNGVQTVIQNIGWYPATNWKSITTTAPIEGKLVDDGNHEFNASLLMKLARADFERVLTHIRYLARFIRYDIDDYNCTDFALNVFNYVCTDKLNIPLYPIPGSSTPGSHTPQGLYTALEGIKDLGLGEASNIQMDCRKSFVAYSHGPCH